MRIDRTHRPWAIAAVALVLASLIVYVWSASSQPGNLRGATAAGLAFGFAGYAVMLFEGLLGARKVKRAWLIGKAQTWMRAHLWLGLVTLPLILFHAGFAFQGPLAFVLMMLLFVVYLSGILGAVLQHYLPPLITSRVRLETIYEEIPHRRRQLCEAAEELVATLAAEGEQGDKVRFCEAWASNIRPFLDAPQQVGSPLADERKSAAVFESFRRSLPIALHPALDDLQSICEEERQLTRQRKIHHWLHVWLLVHVPLSIALLVLGGVHAIVATRY